MKQEQPCLWQTTTTHEGNTHLLSHESYYPPPFKAPSEFWTFDTFEEALTQYKRICDRPNWQSAIVKLNINPETGWYSREPVDTKNI